MEKIHISKGYCDISRETSSYIIQRHFIQHISTTELMKEMKTEEERENVAVVALLNCHNYIRQMLADEGLKL